MAAQDVSALQAQVNALQAQIQQMQSSTPTSSFTRDLSLRAQHDDVKKLQRFLISQGYYSGPITGYFWNQTLAAVKRFQAAKGLPQTGYFGPRSRAAANSVLTAVAPQPAASASSSQNLIIPAPSVAGVTPGFPIRYPTTTIGAAVPSDTAGNPITSTPTLRLLTPNGGEGWRVGDSQSIAWTLTPATFFPHLYFYFLDQDESGGWSVGSDPANTLGSAPSYEGSASIILTETHIGGKKLKISSNPNEVAGICLEPGKIRASNCPLSPLALYLSDESDASFTIYSSSGNLGKKQAGDSALSASALSALGEALEGLKRKLQGLAR